MTVTYHSGRRIQGLEEDRIGATASQGNNGGSGLGGDNTNTGGGGGGGAGAAGANAANSAAGNGGDGLQSDITGTNTYYAGGGGGGTWANISGDPSGGTGGLGGGGNGGEHYDNPSTQTAGTANTGGGGGAAGSTDNTTKAGGSGVVILQFTTSGTSYSTTGSPTVDTSSVSGKTILKYTGSGTFVLSSGSPDVRYLVVGGGGGGAGTAGGGGGAGGFLTGTKSSLAIGTYTVTVGAGGAGHVSGLLASNGENSSFAGVVASGGGGGSTLNSSAPAGADGGSGGGGGGRYGGAGGSTVLGTTISAISPNVQVGSRFEETDTRKMYNYDDEVSSTSASTATTENDNGVNEQVMSSANFEFIGEKVVNSSSALYGLTVNKIGFMMKKREGSPTGTATACVMDSSANILYTFGTVDVSTLPSTYTWTYFTNTLSTYTLTTGNYIGIKYNGGDVNNRIGVYWDNNGSYDGTNSQGAEESGGVWDDRSAQDLRFKIFTGTAFIPKQWSEIGA